MIGAHDVAPDANEVAEPRRRPARIAPAARGSPLAFIWVGSSRAMKRLRFRIGRLLGSAAPEEFLTATNRYLIRQQWDEGFATVANLAFSGARWRVRRRLDPVQRPALDTRASD